MSHQITITRTTTTSSGTVMVLNTHYVKSWPGVFKLVETILAAVCVGIAGYYISRYNYGIHDSEHPLFYFILAMFACLVATFCLFLASFISLADSTMLNKTLFEVIYHLLAFLLTLSASLYLLIETNSKKKRYRSQPEEAFLAASIIGLVLSVLYLLSLIFSFRSYKH